MSEGERIRRIQEQAQKYQSRWRPRDASEITLENQAKAARGTAAPQKVAGCCDSVATGKGTNGEYLAILQAAQGCAVCSDPVPSLALGQDIAAPCYNQQAPPFTQQNLSTPYVICNTPGFVTYFPPKISDACPSTQRIFLPS